MGKKEVLIVTDVLREKGWLYYTGTDEKGNITVMRSPMAYGKFGNKKKKDEKEK